MRVRLVDTASTVDDVKACVDQIRNDASVESMAIRSAVGGVDITLKTLQQNMEAHQKCWCWLRTSLLDSEAYGGSGRRQVRPPRHHARRFT
jgi:hypothetical protein